MDKENNSGRAISHDERMKMIEQLSGCIDPSMIDLTDERARYILKLDKN